MRINLNTPFAEKDAAKLLGARWDISKKVWYIVDVENLKPFMRWIDRPAHLAPASKRKKSRGKKKQRDHHEPRTTLSAQSLLPLCNCLMPPWENCIHTLKAQPA